MLGLQGLFLRARPFGSHLPAEKELSVLHHVAEGNGLDETGSLVVRHF